MKWRRLAPEAVVIAGWAAYLFASRGRWVTTLGDPGIWYSELESLRRGAKQFRDVGMAYGPMSMWILEAGVAILGPRVSSIAAIEMTAGVLAALFVVRFSRRFLREPERLAAAAALVGVVFWIPGEGSLLYPYAPAVCLGFLFVLGALLAGVRMSGPSRSAAVAAGALAGAAYLTKQEMGAAAALGLAAGWLCALGPAGGVRRGLWGAGAFLGAVAAGYGVAFRGLPFFAYARANRLWPFAPIPDVWRRQYAAAGGYANAGESARSVLAAVGFLTAAAGAVIALAALSGRDGRARRTALLAAAAGLLAFFAGGGATRVRVLSAAPLGALAALGWCAGQTSRRRSRRDAALAAMAAGSLPLLYRVGFRGWQDGPFSSLGYTLALPVLAGALGIVITRACRSRPSRARRALRIAAFAAAIGAIVQGAEDLRRVGRWPEPREAFESPRGRVWVPPAWARTFREVEAVVTARTAPADPVLFLPESHGLNFLLARDSPLPGVKLDASFGPSEESAAIWRIERMPPPVVFVFEEGFQEFGGAGFGHAFGSRLVGWLEAHYRRAPSAARGGIPMQIFYRLGSPAR